MKNDLGYIINTILIRLETCGYGDVAVGLRGAPAGAATGTEGLKMMLTYFTEMTLSNPKSMDLVRVELGALIVYCSSDGILVNETLSGFSKSD